MKIRPEFMPSQKSHMMSQQQVVRFTHWPEIVKFLRVVMVGFKIFVRCFSRIVIPVRAILES